MNEFDINYDYRKDSICGDPDTDSNKLYEVHQYLWSKKLRNDNLLYLEKIKIGGKFSRYLLKNNSGDNLSSDRMCPHFIGSYRGKLDHLINETDKEEIKYIVRTIGGHIVFPAHKKDGLTINQARGVNKKICDRFDLTLECIKRFYENRQSPLYNTLMRYEDFFKLFENFENYIEFFLLQDFVDNECNVNFSLPFNDFQRTPLPENREEYLLYKEHIFDNIKRRNIRIMNYIKTNSIT